MKIRSANDMQHFKQSGGYQTFIQAQVKGIWGDVAPTIDWNDINGEVRAFIVRSMWVAQCPHCHDVSVAEVSAPFFCQVCAMQGNDHKPAKLIMPDNRNEIEVVLNRRPSPDNRNWELTETVEDLARENKARGVA